MNQTIRLFTNISEFKHNKQLQIVNDLSAVQKKVSELRKWVTQNLHNLNSQTSVYADNNFKIIKKTNQHPYLLSFFLPQSAYDKVIEKQLLEKYPIIVIDLIYDEARKEYNRIGSKFNKVSRENIGATKKLRW